MHLHHMAHSVKQLAWHVYSVLMLRVMGWITADGTCWTQNTPGELPALSCICVIAAINARARFGVNAQCMLPLLLQALSVAVLFCGLDKLGAYARPCPAITLHTAGHS
jgi:hypothetical protein